MKIRSDFVSNSSSCSFIISDPLKACSIFSQAFHNTEVPSSFEEIEIQGYAKNKWFRKVETDITGESSFEDTWKDYRTGEITKKDPEDEGWDSIYLRFSHLIDARKHLDSYGKMSRIRFSCEDYNRDACINLKDLYEFFKRNGCNPEADESEMEFLGDRENDFYKILNTYTDDSA